MTIPVNKEHLKIILIFYSFSINSSIIYLLQSTGPWWKAKVGNKTGLIPSNYGMCSPYYGKIFFVYQALVLHHEIRIANITSIDHYYSDSCCESNTP